MISDMQQDPYPIGRFKETEHPTEDDINKWIRKISKTPQFLKETLAQFND